ncbi:MAG: hypothetical protein SNJ53_03820 [Thermodesulfovibrionales bacterium]
MKKIVVLISAVIFALSIGLIGNVSAQETLGEKWKQEKYKKIDQEAEAKKKQVREKAEDSTKFGYGSTKQTQKLKNEEAKIDEEAKKKKKEVDQTLKELGPAKDKPYKGNK